MEMEKNGVDYLEGLELYKHHVVLCFETLIVHFHEARPKNEQLLIARYGLQPDV